MIWIGWYTVSKLGKPDEMNGWHDKKENLEGKGRRALRDALSPEK